MALLLAILRYQPSPFCILDTMEAASAMYGVTMQELGVTKLVSVKFQHPAA
jgi:chromosome segregation ATPase